jgi:transcriptional regulator with XRE-family HTH domain
MSRTTAPRTRIERLGAKSARDARRSIAADIQSARDDAGLGLRQLAAAAGISHATLLSVERGSHDPTTEVLARLSTALGMSLSVRLYPGTGPLIRDHLQASMLEALLAIAHPRWERWPEVAVYRPVQGVIDLVLYALGEPRVATEAQSDLRRIEQQVRWSRAKADALGDSAADDRGAPEAPARPVSRLLLLRSTARTRAVVAQHAELLRAAYPARAADAHAALTGEAAWPGDAILWCRIEGGRATLLEGPPRGITVGRDRSPHRLDRGRARGR